MRISHFFIDRPIFAAVVSIVFVILGLVSLTRLPVAQFPEIAPPVVNVTGQYPGASAEVVADTVVAPIEQQVNGVEHMLYISSNATGDGRFTISVTFDLGTDLDIALEDLSIDRQLVRMRVQAKSFEAADRLGAELKKFAPFAGARIGAIDTDKKTGAKRFDVTIGLAPSGDTP